MGISLNLCSVYDLHSYIFKITNIPEIKKMQILFFSLRFLFIGYWLDDL